MVFVIIALVLCQFLNSDVMQIFQMEIILKESLQDGDVTMDLIRYRNKQKPLVLIEISDIFVIVDITI